MSNEKGTADENASATSNLSSSSKKDHGEEPEAAAVLNYLRKRGLGSAIVELQRHIDDETKTKKPKTNEAAESEGGDKSSDKIEAEYTAEMEVLEEKYKIQETTLALTTGGGMGYDLDSASAILSWGNGDDSSSTVRIQKETDGEEEDLQNQLEDKIAETDIDKSKQEESRRYLKAFTALQTWVLSLPDEDLPLDDNHSDGKNNNGITAKGNNLETLMTHVRAKAGHTQDKKVHEYGTNDIQSIRPQHVEYQTASFIPASIKPELLSITFPLLVHTYKDLLENNLEESAGTLLSTYRYIHEPSYPTEFRDLDRCCTTIGIKGLNELIYSAHDSLIKAKTIKKLHEEHKKAISSVSPTAKAVEAIEELGKEYNSWVEKHTSLLRKLKDYSFLKKIMSIKWQLNISSITFGFLVRYLSSKDTLLPMSVLLQSRCHVVVEKRVPVSFIPACILEDMIIPANLNSDDAGYDSKESDSNMRSSEYVDVRWAAPVHPSIRAKELGELEVSILKDSDSLPFPRFYLEKEYETRKDYIDAKNRVDFNRALLTNGFRRLAALEVKDEYESGMRRLKGDQESKLDVEFGDPLEPSIMLSTLCSSFDEASIEDPKSPFDEAGIDITCAKMCPPDGRRVAAGCSDSAVRIWSMDSWTALSGKGSVDSSCGASCNESVVVLLGHKRGLPIFDLDWNRDGRTLISAGGDGSLRLWDTKAVGSYGELTRTISKQTPHASGTKSTFLQGGDPCTYVPDAKLESKAQRHGSALVCYQGHAPSTPVLSVSIAPCGYYFASAGSDSTARLWCTDRPTPVRVFTGHLNENVNCVSWQPNCNFIVTGSDDKTVRMWDIQSGNGVRLLSGCAAGVNNVKVSPSGQLVAGSDYNGTVHIWDIRNGRKLHEFRHNLVAAKNNLEIPVIESLTFSPCGTALATGSDDCTIRIWETLGLGDHSSNPEFVSMHRGNSSKVGTGSVIEPAKTFRTRKTSILDLQYTKRNLILSVGKYFSQ